jgi:hypothetical protein
MTATVRYLVTSVRGDGDQVYGHTPIGEIRYLGRVGADLSECARGDTIEIDYDDSIDKRGELVAARKVTI